MPAQLLRSPITSSLQNYFVVSIVTIGWSMPSLPSAGPCRCCDADASVCSLLADTPSRHRPRAFLQPRSTLSIIAMQLFSFAAALPPLDSAANWHSNPIAHRVRRKRQRLPPSLLIENASDRVPLRCQSSCPRRFRSSLATIRQQLPWQGLYLRRSTRNGLEGIISVPTQI